MLPKALTTSLLLISLLFLNAPTDCASAPPKGGNWPSFRGPNASGVADQQNLPVTFDGDSLRNVLWKQEIPGLAHSSPIVWGDQLFVTSAISGESGVSFKSGLYGSGDASPDHSPQQWKVYCLNKKTGDLVWEVVATEGIPKDKRHIKATYANSTPVTDGRYVVAFFGSQGVYAFDLAGEPLWQRDLGRLNVGAYDAPSYEWGSASSPIIFEDTVILQCDTQADDFVIALDLQDGHTVWKSTRDEFPSWGTPTIFSGEGGVELVTNGANFIRGYNPRTGA